MSQPFINGPVSVTSPTGQNDGLTTAQGSSGSGSSFEILTVGTRVGPGSFADITHEQALERVNNLFSENSELREYLKENNEMMKDQYQTMAKWKDKIHKSSGFNKQKADEARSLIQSLQTRNEELEASVIESQSFQRSDLVSALQEEKMTLMKEVKMLRERLSAKPATGEVGSMETVYVTQNDEQIKALQEECDKYRIRTIDSENQAQLYKQQSDQLLLDLQSIQALKDGAQSENQMLKVANQNLIDRCNCLEGKRLPASAGECGIAKASDIDISIGSLGYTMVDPHQYEKQTGERLEMGAEQVMYFAAQAENADLRHKLEKTDSELKSVTELFHQKEQLVQHYQQQEKQFTGDGPQLVESQVQQSPSYNGDIQSLKSQVLTLISEVHEYQTKLTSATDALDVSKASVSSLEQKCSEQEEEAKNFQMENGALIRSLRDALTNTEQVLMAEKQQTKDVSKSFDNLYKIYTDLVEENKQKIKPEQSATQEAQTKQLLDDIDRLTAQVIGADEAITYREDRINQLQQAYDGLKTELDNIVPVLKAQAEVFKADFEAERKARERAHTEKDKLNQDMCNLQVQNQQLLDDVENLSKRQLMEMQQRHAPVTYGQKLHSYLHIAGTSRSIGRRGYNYDAPSSLETSSFNDQPQSRWSEPSQHDESENPDFSCPKCDMQCPDVDTLQIHVLECIDEN